jgi:hypothetical protein
MITIAGGIILGFFGLVFILGLLHRIFVYKPVVVEEEKPKPAGLLGKLVSIFAGDREEKVEEGASGEVSEKESSQSETEKKE